MNTRYIPRHAAPLPGQPDLSATARAITDQHRADIAVVVLAATDTLPASRELYRRLLRSGALHIASAA
jgi:hypothetical protein